MLNLKLKIRWKKIKLKFELGANNSNSDSFDVVPLVNLVKYVVWCTLLLKVLQHFGATLFL